MEDHIDAGGQGGRIAAGQVGALELGSLGPQLFADGPIPAGGAHPVAALQQQGDEDPAQAARGAGDQRPPYHRITAPPSEMPAELPISSDKEPGSSRPVR